MPSKSDSPEGWANRNVGRSTLIFLAAAIYLAVGVASYVAWQLSGNLKWIDSFFGVPGGLLTVTFAAIELHFSIRVRSQFNPGETLYRAWQFISLSAALDFISALAIQVLSSRSGSNPLTHLPGWSPERAASIRQFGLTTGGPLRFALLSGGLYYALDAYRKSGFLGSLRKVDWIILAVAALYVINEFRDVWIAMQHGKRPGWAEIANWPVDPLLCLLLAEAMLLYSSSLRMGPGWIGRCWVAFSVGIALVALGDVSVWAMNYGYLPYPWSNIGWYLWLPGAAAFAVAPIYQLEVIQRATAPPVGRQKPG